VWISLFSAIPASSRHGISWRVPPMPAGPNGSSSRFWNCGRRSGNPQKTTSRVRPRRFPIDFLISMSRRQRIQWSFICLNRALNPISRPLSLVKIRPTLLPLGPAPLNKALPGLRPGSNNLSAFLCLKYKHRGQSNLSSPRRLIIHHLPERN
jgi:hypothetical protein